MYVFQYRKIHSFYHHQKHHRGRAKEKRKEKRTWLIKWLFPSSLYLSHDWERLARGNSRATRRGLTVPTTLHDWQLRSSWCVSSCVPFFLFTDGKIVAKREEKNDPPTEKNWSAPLGRLKDLLYYATHRWGERRRRVIAPSQRATYQHDRHDITAPNRTHHVNRMNGDESTFPILAAAEFTMMKIQWIIKTLQTSLMGELEGKSIVLPQTFLVDEWWDWWPCKKIIIVPSSSQFKIPPFRFFYSFLYSSLTLLIKSQNVLYRGQKPAQRIQYKETRNISSQKQQTVVDNIYPVNDRRR